MTPCPRFRYGRGYIPLNSLTLGTRLRQQQASSESSSESSKGAEGKVKKHPNGGGGEAWWQMLPKEKVHQNKVIRKKLESIQNSVPKWPWMKGYQKEPEGAKYSSAPLGVTNSATPSYTKVKFPSSTSTISSIIHKATTTTTREVTKSTIKTGGAENRCDHSDKKSISQQSSSSLWKETVTTT